MADTVRTSRELKLVAQFTDGDDRTLSIPNPLNNLEASAFNGNEVFVNSAKKVLVGDKTGAPFQRWKSAKVVESTTVYLDLTSAD